MKKFDILYCTECKKETPHGMRMGATLRGARVCNVCSAENGICTLLKPEDPHFKKTSKEVKWLEYKESGTITHDNPEVGYGLLMGPFNYNFTWQTTIIVEILEKNEKFVKFRTENTLYELYLNPMPQEITLKENDYFDITDISFDDFEALLFNLHLYYRVQWKNESDVIKDADKKVKKIWKDGTKKGKQFYLYIHQVDDKLIMTKDSHSPEDLEESHKYNKLNYIEFI